MGSQERKRRVLVVDADPSFSHALGQEFIGRSFDVETAATANQAIACVAAAPPDLVILDLYLPNESALTLLRMWKAVAPEMVVILVSGNASLSHVVSGLSEGAQRFFTKPVSAATLLHELEERLGSHPPPLEDPHQLGMAAMHADGVDRFFAISPGLLSVAGFDGYFKMLNPAWEEALGWTVEELCARPYLELVHPDDCEKAKDEALELRSGHTVFRFKNRYRCKDGSYRWLTWSATPSPSQRLIYGSARDVTKTVVMEEGLRQSNDQLRDLLEQREALLGATAIRNDSLVELAKHKDEVTAMIVHDLKNPLSVIVGNYDYILGAFEGPSDCREALQDSQHAGHRMLRLLANLVDVARLETEASVVHAVETTLSALLSPIVHQRRRLAHGHKVAIDLADSLGITVSVDADLMTRTVENIFDNALRHTPAGGRVQISFRETGQDVEIRIGNSGSAIPAEVREQIFRKHQQSSAGLGHLNLGLGLYFCRLSTEAHGGKIWVEETAELPTVFVIRLPVAGRVGEKVPARAETSASPPARFELIRP